MAQRLKALHYVQPDFDAFRLEFINAVQKFKKCESVGQVHAAIQNIDNLTKNVISSYETLKTLAVQNPDNLAYQKELVVWQQQQVLLSDNNNRFFTGLLKSKFRNQLESMLPPVKFILAENHVASYTTENNALIAEENELLLAYKKLLTSVDLELEGVLIPLHLALRNYSTFTSLIQRKIVTAATDFLSLHGQELLSLYQKIIANRFSQTNNANFSNYGDLKLKVSNHFDYSLTEIIALCQHILVRISPQKNQPNILTPTPITNFTSDTQLLNYLETMFANISPEMATFFAYLVEHDVIKIIADSHVKTTSVETFILYNETPQITINRNSLPSAFATMINQLGRSFQAYCVRGLRSSDLLFSLPTSQASIAKSFEFITLPAITKTALNSKLDYQQAQLNKNISALRLAAANIIFLTICYQADTFNPVIITNAWYQEHNIDWPNQTDMLWLFDFELLNAPFIDIDTILSTLIGLQFWNPIPTIENDTNLDDYSNLAKHSSNLAFKDLIGSIKGLLSPIEPTTVDLLLKKIDSYKETQTTLNDN